VPDSSKRRPRKQGRSAIAARESEFPAATRKLGRLGKPSGLFPRLWPWSDEKGTGTTTARLADLEHKMMLWSQPPFHHSSPCPLVPFPSSLSHFFPMQYRYSSERSSSWPLLITGVPLKTLSSPRSFLASSFSSLPAARTMVPPVRLTM